MRNGKSTLTFLCGVIASCIRFAPRMCGSLHRDLAEAHGQVTSNRVAQLVRTLYNFGRREGLFSGENPVQLTMFKESSRTRFLQPPELQRLFKALDSRSTPRDLKDFVKLSLFLRRPALRHAVDAVGPTRFRARRLAHTIAVKNSVPYDVPLMNEAIEILKRRSKDSDWVFASVTSASGHLEDLKRNWPDLLVRAEITDLKIHDLRRSFGSYQAALGGSLLIIGPQLGPRVDCGYQHLFAVATRSDSHVGRCWRHCDASGRKSEKARRTKANETPTAQGETQTQTLAQGLMNFA